MDTSKIIRGVVSNGRYTVTAPIVKEDYGLYLKIEGVELPSTYEVDFSNSENNGTSVTMIGNADGVLIPRQFIDSGKDVFAFLYHVGEDFGRTVYKFRIPNKVRPDRTNEQPTPEEQSTIDQAISALNEAVAHTAQDVISADQSARSASDDADRAEQAKDDAVTFAQRSANSAQASADYSASASQSAQTSAQSASEAETARQETTSLVAEAQRYANASEQSATASANSAEQAESAKGVAQSYAQDAQTSATYASMSESTASSKATEASGYADTASAKASESAQSATNAQTYATQAESAKTASQTAQGKAEDAQTAAETAQGLAEDARDEAQTLVDSITGKVEQIDSNTERIESLEDDRYKPYPTDTASGAIASFTDGADGLPLKSLVVDINPVQDLSQGDPSPENICPISGWTEVDVEQSGVNVWDEEWELGYINPNNGNNASSNNCIRSKNYIRVKPNVAYYFKCPNATGVNIKIAQYDANKGYISPLITKANDAVIMASNCQYIRFFASDPYGATYNHDISINYPSTDHSYHPYTGRSITINLGQTVYGGKLDVLSGKLTVDRALWQKNTATMNNNEDYPGWRNAGVREIVGGDMSIPYEDQKINIGKKFAVNTRGTNDILYLAIRDYGKTQTEWQALAIDAQIVIPLATPITIQLTPHEVNSLLGQNNIFADTGDTEVEYRADTKLFIAKKIAEAIASLT